MITAVHAWLTEHRGPEIEQFVSESSDPFFITEIPSNARQLHVQGAVWWVYEDARTYAPFYGPALLFKGEHIARRIRDYPKNWRELSDEALYALSWSR